MFAKALRSGDIFLILKVIVLLLLGIYTITAYILHLKPTGFLFPSISLTEVTNEERVDTIANGTLVRGYGEDNSPCIIFFPGQRGGIKHYERTLFNHFQSVGFQVFSLSYPGQEGAMARVDSIGRFIGEIKEEVKSISLACLPSKTIVYGRSLGATLAAYSANTPYIAGVILEGASVSLDKAIYHYLYKRWYLKPLTLLPIQALLRESYPLLDALAGLSEKPVVIYQGELDEVTPLRDISILFNHSDTVDLKVIANAKHHNTYQLALTDIIETINHMVKN